MTGSPESQSRSTRSRHGPSDPSSGVFEVVFVCTGNRARSPLAEALFRRYSTGLQTSVSSAGTLDVGPLTVLPEAFEAGRRLGVDLTSHRARPLHNSDLSSADLVLGFEPSHIGASVLDGGADPGRAFLLAEFAHLLDEMGREPDPVTARSAIAAADSRRLRYRPDRAFIVRDPLGKPAKTMHRTAAQIDDLVRRVVFRLFGEPAGTERGR